jgi:hypothetical protein
MTASTQGQAFVVMPFGQRKASDGSEINFDQIYEQLFKPAVEAAGLRPHRADAELRGGPFMRTCSRNSSSQRSSSPT